jgi:hypothetical protein
MVHKICAELTLKIVVSALPASAPTGAFKAKVALAAIKGE